MWKIKVFSLISQNYEAFFLKRIKFVILIVILIVCKTNCNINFITNGTIEDYVGRKTTHLINTICTYLRSIFDESK